MFDDECAICKTTWMLGVSGKHKICTHLHVNDSRMKTTA